jgi:hypothetical protein
VLGGGFIKSATAKNAGPRARVRDTLAPPFAEVMRG